MTRIANFALTAAIALSLSACSSNNVSVSGGQNSSQTTPQGLTAGNWFVQSTSNTSFNLTNDYSGPLAVSGSTPTLTAFTSVPCISNNFSTILFTGAVSGNNVTFMSPAFAGSKDLVALSGVIYNGTNIDGTYQITGGATTDPCYGQSGTVYGIFVPPISGTWNGTVEESAFDQSGQPVLDVDGAAITNVASATAMITQAPSPVAFGKMQAYPLNGTFIFTNSLCYNTGVIDSASSYIVGRRYNLVVDTDTGVVLTSSGALDPAHPNTISLSYTVPSGICQYYQVGGAITNP